MKKTEKIEIRLSHDEKLELAALAESEGRSVSELIRHLVKRYMTLNARRLPKRTPWIALGATALAAFLAGHLLTYAIARHGHHDVLPHQFFITIDPIDALAQEAELNTPIIVRDGYVKTFVLPTQGADYEVTFAVQDLGGDYATLKTSLCRTTSGDCIPQSIPTLTIQPRQDSTAIFKLDSGETIQISVAPPALR